MAAQAEESKAAATGCRRRGHPLLRGCKRERYTHGMHPAQMEALRAMCGALIPSLPVVEGHHGDDAGRGGGKDLERFYLASAADGTVPDEVAELVTRCVWEAVVLVNVVLWILSTRVGTLALCGRLCISGKFPYIRKFANMPVEQREEALIQWNKARWLFPLKITFVVTKILSHYAFYTMEIDTDKQLDGMHGKALQTGEAAHQLLKGMGSKKKKLRSISSGKALYESDNRLGWHCLGSGLGRRSSLPVCNRERSGSGCIDKLGAGEKNCKTLLLVDNF